MVVNSFIPDNSIRTGLYLCSISLLFFLWDDNKLQEIYFTDHINGPNFDNQ